MKKRTTKTIIWAIAIVIESIIIIFLIGNTYDLINLRKAYDEKLDEWLYCAVENIKIQDYFNENCYCPVEEGEESGIGNKPIPENYYQYQSEDINSI